MLWRVYIGENTLLLSESMLWKLDLYPVSMVQKAIKPIMPIHLMWSVVPLNSASVFGLPQPAAPRGRANQAPTYLPAHHKVVHLKYQEVCTQEGKPFMQYRSFIDA